MSVPDQFNSGGNTDTGKTAKAFLEPKNREKVLDLYQTDSDDQRQKLSTLLQNLNVILRVTSSTRKIKVKKFHQR